MTRTHPLRTILGITTTISLICGAATFGPALRASALHGDAQIKPIESDISAKSWASVKAGSGASTADLAIDQDERTAWIAGGTPSRRWLTLDLGGAYDNVRKVRVVFPDAGAVYQYVIEASANGTGWHVIADHSANHRPSRGSVDLFTRPATRYVRVRITGASPGATVGIGELNVYNYLREDLVLGSDASWVDNDVAEGRNYWVNPLEADRGAGPHLLDVLKDRGFEYTRLRIFNEPRSEGTGDPLATPYQGPERSAEVAKWVTARNMGLGVDLHYADSWADPSKQPKPRAWARLEFDDLTEAVYDYTYAYIERLIEQGTTPDKVAVGNEIANGFMFGSEAALAGVTAPAYFRDQPEIYRSQPGGGLLWNYWRSTDPDQRRLYDEAWDRFTTLSAAGVRAVRDVSAAHDKDIKVETHVITSGIEGKTLEFWNQYLTRIKAKGADTDVIAHSYYPQWHGSPEYYESVVNAVAAAHPAYEIEVAETSYPASGGGGTPLPDSPYPRTVQGQADALQRVFQIVNDIPGNRGLGVLAWEPARWESLFRAVPGMTNTYEPNASIDVFTGSHASHVVEDTVYAAARVGDTIALPDSVRVLTTADGSAGPAPVVWDAVPDGGTGTAGRLTVRGSTAFGSVTAVVDVVDAYAALHCDRTITGRYSGRLTVTGGVTCLERATMSGEVSVRTGASLRVNDTVIAGPVEAEGAGAVVVCGSRVFGPVSVSGASSVTFGNPRLGCTRNTIIGRLTVTGTRGWNVIAGNEINGPLSCADNAVPPVNNGFTNAVTGPKSGQCGTL
ncbi:glycosyl hydrolase 53 family protein [Streptosporangium sp. NPDC023615]|uniref:glycosyl hydrolase 53 family protein n=1 Tax=Streptosporangium sp. NPDC023615 TaxID=3154794 RepID=UPI00342BC43E